METIYGFKGIGLEALAAEIERACGVPLYRQMSPMIGPWYTDTDLSEVLKAVREGRFPEANPPAERFGLTLNDPEPGYQGPQFGGGYQCLLRFGGAAEDRPALEAKLREAGLMFARLKP